MRTKTHPTINISGLAGRRLGQAYQAERGMALVVTLFVVALLTVLVLEYHFDAVIELDMAASYADDVRAHHLALAGMQFAQALLQRDDPKSDGPEDTWYTLGLLPACIPPQQLLELAASAGTAAASGPRSPSPFAPDSQESASAQDTAGNVGCVVLRISDESGKLPINALDQSNASSSPPPVTPRPGRPRTPPPRQPNPPRLPNAANPNPWKDIFTKFFESFEINKDVIGALKDWIDADPEEEPDGGAEESYYNSLPTPYKPPNHPMRMLGELRLIKGFDTDTLAKLFPGMSPQAVADVDLGRNPYLTPYGEGAEARVNLNTADPVVLHALIAGLSGDESCVADYIVPTREQKQLEDVQEAQAQCLRNSRNKLVNFAGVSSTYFRIEASGQVGAIQKKVVAVVKRRSGTQSTPTMVYFKIE